MHSILVFLAIWFVVAVAAAIALGGVIRHGN